MRLGAMLHPGDAVFLSGDLGSGKTTLVQGIAQGWGSLDPVSSPTFMLVNVYRRPDGMNMMHLDAYRLESALDAEDLDITQLLDSHVLLVEWAERIISALPAEYLQIRLRWIADEQRGMVFIPKGERYERLLVEFRRKAFGG